MTKVWKAAKKVAPPVAKKKQPAVEAAEDASVWKRARRNDKMSERLARQIVNDIVSQNRGPGFKLPAEGDMVRDYHVSRGTLREALRLLEMQGLIEVKPGPGGGPIIAELHPTDFARMLKFHFRIRGSTYRDVLIARLAIEPVMARLAAEASDPKGLAALAKVIERCEQTDLDDEHEWRESSHLFHGVVASMSGNTLLNLLGLSLKHIYHDWATSSITPRRMRAEVLAVHKTIAKAIFAGDGAKAERLMREHMLFYAECSGDLHSTSLDERIRWT
jgi:GntR family transcriptional regulator, transcriptional repressor for pyruvate dehydrogenase complex